jgi:hypothetical protein
MQNLDKVGGSEMKSTVIQKYTLNTTLNGEKYISSDEETKEEKRVSTSHRDKEVKYKMNLKDTEFLIDNTRAV